MTIAAGRVFRDAVHGVVSFGRTPLLTSPNVISDFVAVEPVDRLGRLRQLPFALPRFPSATHTRLAHSIGTAHMTLAFVERLSALRWFTAERVDELQSDLSAVGLRGADGLQAIQVMTAHATLAGLLQDLGELPSKQVLENFLSPHRDLIDEVADQLDLDLRHADDKAIFTLAAMLRTLQQRPTPEIEPGLLAYLMTGLAPTRLVPSTTLRSLRQVLDGSIDSDRLDYIARDSYFTIGLNASGQVAAQAIASVVDLTEEGIVVDDPTAISLLLLQRAVLRTEVFVAGEVRFRSTLLASILSGLLREQPALFDELFHAEDATLTLDSFIRLDDRRVDDILDELSRRSDIGLGVDASRALQTARTVDPAYDFVWLPVPESSGSTASVTLHNDTFVDTLFDVEHHALFKPRSIFVSGPQWRHGGDVVALEQTGGHVAQFMSAGADADPVTGKYLCFVPGSRRAWIDQLVSGPADELVALHAAALERDALMRTAIVDDTSGVPGFFGPTIFVSYCTVDVSVVRRILVQLRALKRRYKALVRPTSGIGHTPRENSTELAAACDAALLVLSREYVRRYGDQSGNISAEVQTLIGRHADVPIVALTVDSYSTYDDLEREFPWIGLGFSGPTFTGPALFRASAGQYREAVAACVAEIDARHRVAP